MASYFTEENKTKCSGCRCCQHICQVCAISMVSDEEGFLYPEINKELCTNCGMCEETCPFSSDINSGKRLEQPLVYAVSHKDKLVLKKSSSGGMFSALAELVLQKGGAIVGCVFDDELNPIQIIAENNEQILKMRGSKYIQSDTKATFPETEKTLKLDKWVLYTGTPCQIAGLKAYLKIYYEKLLTVDLICHGTPSNKFFHEYLFWLERKLNGKITEYHFRDKSKYGWASVGSFTYQKNGKIYIKQLLQENDYYYYSYKKGNVSRECCYACKYASQIREGDFTIGDYWNIDQFHSEFYPPEGVSLVLVNTEKATQIFNEIADCIMSVPSKLEYALKSNGNLSRPSTTRKSIRDIVYKDVKRIGFEAAVKKHCKIEKLIPLFKRAVPYSVKTKIKKLLKA